jgi:NAD(P)-dependent dehydrogenase (short-subunit alcohol dehydrogenase family)
MTKLMSRDLAPRIRVNAVAPGSTWTPALERYYTAAELEAKIARRRRRDGAIRGGRPTGAYGAIT